MSLIDALSSKNVNQFLKCVKSLEPSIGTFGGRRFHQKKGIDGNIPQIKETVCINDIVVRFEELHCSLPLDETNQQKASEILRRIKTLDSDANKLSENSNLFQRILTALRSWLGDLKMFIHREDILTPIESRIKNVLAPILEKRRQEEEKLLRMEHEKFMANLGRDVRNIVVLLYSVQLVIMVVLPMSIVSMAILGDKTCNRVINL